MTGRIESGRQEPRDTLLLYCPYDRRVTRHARRGAEQTVTCLECGRPIDVVEPGAPAAPPPVYEQRTARFSPITEPPPARRSQALPRRRRTATSWVPILVVAAALVVGVFAAINVAGRLTAPSAGPPAATSGQAAGPTSVRGGQPTQQSSASPAPTQALTVLIGNTGGEGAYIRRTTNLDDRLRPWPDNTRLSVLGPDVTVDGRVWKAVRDPTGNEGWIPADYTRAE